MTKSRSKRPTIKAFKQFSEEAGKITGTITFDALNEIAELKKDKDALHAHIDNLEHQAIGYQAVISYLEHKLNQ
jgi:ribosomal protein L11